MQSTKASVAWAICSLFAVPFAAHAAPTVSITSPTSGATVSGTSVICAANASDSNGINQVQFYLDGTALPQDSTPLAAPWTCNFDTTKFADGRHTMGAEVTFTDGMVERLERQVYIKNTTAALPELPKPVLIQAGCVRKT